MNTASAEPALTGEDAVASGVSTDDGRAVESSACPHCGVGVEGGADTFCCHGCEAAFAIIHEAGLERYYESRTDLPPRPEPWRERWDALAPPADADGTCEMRLAIDGLRCASCVWVTERVLRSTPGVIDAQVSYATGRATLTWDPEVVPAGELARRIATLGYRPRVLGRESGVDRSLLTRLGVSAFAATNVMMFSAALYAGWLGPMDAGFVALFRWGSLVLATPVALWAASPFFEGAWSGLRHRVLHMDLPIAIAIGVLYLQGIAGTLVGFDTYLDSLTMLVTLLLAGRVLESGGRRKAADAALTLAATVPSTARRTRGDSVEVVASSALVPGDRVSVGAGEDLPADGVVLAGRGRLQRSLLTGESVPVPVREGDEVWAGTVLVDGAVTVVVSVPAEETVVQQMAARLRRAADEALTPGASDRIAPWFTGVTLAVAMITFLAWFPVAGAGTALSTTIAVLIVACPCALALSRPLTAAAGLGAAARRGLLFRSPDALLASADVDLVALDKTGTLTEGGEVVAHASDEHLRIAAGLERFSRHPLAVAIVREAVARGLPLPDASYVHEVPGVGIRGRVDGTDWALQSGGASRLKLSTGGVSVGEIVVGDRVRGDSAAVVADLRRLGLEVIVLSGDTPGPTREISTQLGGTDFRAALTPEEKASTLSAWRDAGRTTLFVGDGLNDGPALAAADVGVAMGSGAASSILAADALLGTTSIAPLPAGLLVGRATVQSVRASQARSIVYNVVAVTAAAAGLVNPLVAAVLMPLSSAMVLAGAVGLEGRVRRAESSFGFAR